MKRWAVMVVALYVAVVVVLTGPALWLVMGVDYGGRSGGDDVPFRDVVARYEYWILLGVLAVAQALFLFVPVKSAGDLQVRPRSLFVPLSVAAALSLALVAGLVGSVWVAFFQDSGGEIGRADRVACVLLLAIWGAWLWLFRGFYRAFKADGDPGRFMGRLSKSLLSGSIVELLVAVGSHILVRRRGDCCSPVFTLFAMAAGAAVMLLSFGPGLFYLFAARRRRMTSSSPGEPPPQGPKRP